MYTRVVRLQSEAVLPQPIKLRRERERGREGGEGGRGEGEGGREGGREGRRWSVVVSALEIRVR
jgi:hypothetical protein